MYILAPLQKALFGFFGLVIATMPDLYSKKLFKGRKPGVMTEYLVFTGAPWQSS